MKYDILSVEFNKTAEKSVCEESIKKIKKGVIT